MSYFKIIEIFLFENKKPNYEIVKDNIRLNFDNLGIRHLYSYGKQIAKFHKDFNSVNIFLQDRKQEKHISWLKLVCNNNNINYYEMRVKDD